MLKSKILIATTALATISMAFCESVRAADTGSCGTNCIYTYENGTLTYSVADPTQNNGEAIVSTKSYEYGLSGSINNIVVEEGIVSINKRDAMRCTNCHVTFPKSLSYVGQYSLRAVHGVVELNSNVHNLVAYSLMVQGDATLIMPAISDITIADNFSYDGNAAVGRLNVVCKGDASVCATALEGKFSWYNQKGGSFNVSNILYDSEGKKLQEWANDGSSVKYDPEGNVVEKYNTDGNIAEKYDSKGNTIATYSENGKQTASYNYSAGGKLLSANTYDSEGNVNGSYTYDAGGNLVSAYQNGKAVYLRKRYTIPEADAATQGKGPFRLDITW